MAAAAGTIDMKISKAKLETIVGQLEGYVSDLEDKLSQYHAKRREIEDIWSDDEATKYKQGIDASIEKIDETIHATNVQIGELRKAIAAKEASESEIGGKIDDVVTVVQALF